MDNLKAEKVFVEKGELLAALYDADAITMKGVKIINQFPTAEVAPVQRAKWIPCDNGGYYCSYCEGRVAFKFGNLYCPNCGARMDGDS